MKSGAVIAALCDTLPSWLPNFGRRRAYAHAHDVADKCLCVGWQRSIYLLCKVLSPFVSAISVAVSAARAHHNDAKHRVS